MNQYFRAALTVPLLLLSAYSFAHMLVGDSFQPDLYRIIGMVLPVLLIFLLWRNIKYPLVHKEAVDKWAGENGLRIISVRPTRLLEGPSQWPSGRADGLPDFTYRIKASDQVGLEKDGWLFLQFKFFAREPYFREVIWDSQHVPLLSDRSAENISFYVATSLIWLGVGAVLLSMLYLCVLGAIVGVPILLLLFVVYCILFRRRTGGYRIRWW